MNRNYGKLVGGEVEYAPAKITKDDGTVVMSPSAETYLADGWKRIVDERPAPEEGGTVEVSGWDEIPMRKGCRIGIRRCPHRDIHRRGLERDP